VRAPQHAVGFDLDGAEGGSGVGGEERVTGATGEDHDPPLLEVADGAAADVRLGDLRHVDGRLHPGRLAEALERVLQRQRVDDRGQHAHVVGGRAVHAARARGQAAEDVAATDDDRRLNAEALDSAKVPSMP
jgi:hypothetical protein